MELTLFDKNQFPWIPSSVSFSKEKSYPKISVIVPSYNQGEYLEETLLSIIRQNYPHLELIVIDGGSTDHSLDIIRQYQEHITYWVSEKDRGQSHAINRGFEKATGDWIAWMNSDDCYLEGAFYTLFEKQPHEKYDFLFGNCSPGVSMSTRRYRPVTTNYRKSIYQLLLFFQSTQYMIPSQSVFVRRFLLDKAGYLDETCHYVMDMEWYVRIYRATARRLFYKDSVCFYRVNDTTKTGSAQHKMMAEARRVALHYLPELPLLDKLRLKRLLRESEGFEREFDMFGNIGLGQMGKIFWRYPLSALSNIHFLAYLKNKLLSRK